MDPCTKNKEISPLVEQPLREMTQISRKGCPGKVTRGETRDDDADF